MLQLAEGPPEASLVVGSLADWLVDWDMSGRQRITRDLVRESTHRRQSARVRVGHAAKLLQANGDEQTSD